MTDEELVALALTVSRPDWYGLFRHPGGFRRVPVADLRVKGAYDEELDLEELGATFDPDEIPDDGLGGFLCLGVFHPRYYPEPPELAEELA